MVRYVKLIDGHILQDAPSYIHGEKGTRLPFNYRGNHSALIQAGYKPLKEFPQPTIKEIESVKAVYIENANEIIKQWEILPKARHEITKLKSAQCKNRIDPITCHIFRLKDEVDAYGDSKDTNGLMKSENIERLRKKRTEILQQIDEKYKS